MDHEDRVLSLADLKVFSLEIPPVSLALFADFPARDPEYYREREKIGDGDHAAEDSDKPHPDADLL